MRKGLFIIACIGALSWMGSERVQGTDLTWTNSAGGNWTAAANWSPNQVPGSTDTAIITNAGTYTVTVNAFSAVEVLRLGDGDTNSSPTLFISSALDIGGSGVIASNAAVQLSSTLSGGVVTNHGYFEWDASVLSGTNDFVNAEDGHVYLTTSNFKYLRRPFQNFGLIEFNTTPAHNMKFRDPGTLTNDATGEITFARNAGFDLDTGSTVDCKVVNFGTITASGSGQSPSKMDVPFINYGTFDVPGVCNVGDGTNYGVLNAPNGSSQILFRLGDYSLETGTELRGVGLVMAYTTGILRVNTPLVCSNHFGTSTINGNTPQLYLNASMTNLNTITMSRGLFYITNPAVVLDAKTFGVGHYLTNAGTVIADTLTVSSSLSSIDNAGTLIVRSNFNFNRNTIDQRPNGHLITEAGCATSLEQAANNTSRKLIGGLWDNYGTVTIPYLGSLSASGGAGWINHTNAIIQANGNGLVSNSGGTNWFVNYGTLERTALASGPTWALVTTNYGTVSALSTIMSFGDYVQYSGVTDLRNSTINSAQFHILGGELRGKCNVGSGSSLYNAGDFHPGSEIGTFKLTGLFTNDSSGTCHMEIAGNSSYDTVDVAGTAQLAGTLNVILTNGFFPTIGNTFTAMTYTAYSGTFDSIENPLYQFEPVYTPTALLLLSSNALPTATIEVTGGSTQIVCRPFQIQAAASDLDGSITNLSVTMNGFEIAASPSSSLTTTVEKDFPSTNMFVVKAWDDRGGVSTTTQQVDLVTLPLHVLTLGGVRTNGFKICMLGEPGRDYTVLANTNLTTTNWTAIGTMEATNGIWRYYDADVITNFQQRYYRTAQQ